MPEGDDELQCPDIFGLADEQRFEDLLADYEEALPREPNAGFADVDIEIDPEVLDKIKHKHQLSPPDDVEDIVKGQPPAVVEVPHPDDDEKRLFYGFTRQGRDAFVVGVWAPSMREGRRRLRIVTAFLPTDDEYIAKYFARVHR